MNRRRFLGHAFAITTACAALARESFASPQGPATPPPSATDGIARGPRPLGVSSDGRDGILYVPAGYREDTPAPLLIMLHGYAGWADEMKSTFAQAEELGIVVIAPESRDFTWGREAPGFDEDVRYIGAAYRKVAAAFNIDPDRVGLGGRSDGAGYALSMGLAYGDIFNHLIVIAGGRMNPVRRKGKPKIYMLHGDKDQTMPIELSARRFSAQLKEEGYDITYREYDGGHATPSPLVREALVWLTGGDPKKKDR